MLNSVYIKIGRNIITIIVNSSSSAIITSCLGLGLTAIVYDFLVEGFSSSKHLRRKI